MYLHFDCFSGISGDMTLGALIDAGLSPHKLRKELKALPISGYRLNVSKVHRGGIHATKVDIVISKGRDAPLSWPQIRRLLSTSRLPPWVKTQALSVFKRLAQAEGTVHGRNRATVRFHEVGVIDSLVDVVGSLLGCHELGIQTFGATPVNVGSGTIHGAHGTLPVPGPAVTELAKGSSIYARGPAMEFTTPTGMALLTTLTQPCSHLLPVVPRSIGYGAGTADPPDWPNVLRVFLSSSTPAPILNGLTPGLPLSLEGLALSLEGSTEPLEADQVIQLETTIDDLNPQLYEAVMTRLFENGALDVTLTPTIMKRSRPGTLLMALAPLDRAGVLTQTLFRETTTLGVRHRIINRVTLPRSMKTIRLPQGRVRVKIVHVGNTVTYRPEFQDCQTIAQKTGLPVQHVIEMVKKNIAE